MYYDLCNGTLAGNVLLQCDELNATQPVIHEDWPLERVVSIIVPFFFGVIGLAGLLGNALVIIGKSNF